MCVLCTSTNRPRLDLVLNKQGGKDMRHLQMFQKVENGGGPIFKVVLDSAQRVPEPDPLPGISFNTRPDPIQFWKSSGSG